MTNDKFQMTDELVVLVDERDNQMGTMLKSEVHGKNTLLHRGFSCFLFNGGGEVLVTQRAKGKKTWPGVWSNSCCGHPAPGESYEDAVGRRVRYELGVEIKGLRKVSDYRYRFERDGVVENEICPVFVGGVDGELEPNLLEVGDHAWIEWYEWLDGLKNDGEGKWSE